MKLLITTQAVDLDDQVLGFFHAWIAKLAAEVDEVHVICLKEGRHTLPSNVFVHSLGKPSSPPADMIYHITLRLGYIIRFYRILWKCRDSFDAVFIHMNPEYAVLGGLLWRAWGKRIVLWRNHKMYSPIMRLGVMFSEVVCFTSPDAYVARYRKSVQMPVGIDTDVFKPDAPQRGTVLFLGRFDAVKKPDIFLEAIAQLEREGVPLRVDVYGDASLGRERYATDLKEKYRGLKSVSFHAGISHEATSAIYGTHDIYVNLTPSGSFDKTIGEAMAAGCVVVCANRAVREAIPAEHLVSSEDAESVALGIKSALALTDAERRDVVERERSYVEREHSLSLLVRRLVSICTPH